MRKILSILITLTLLFTLAACDKDNSEDNTPMVNNPPQSEQLSYETNKNGYITSCTLNVDGETFTYQCEGDNYLLIYDTDGNYVISVEAPVADSYIGASETVKRIYFYEGTAQEFVIQSYDSETTGQKDTSIQVFNRAGQVIVDKTPRQNIDNYYFKLSYQPGAKTPLLDTSKEALLTGEAQDLGFDENAITINESIIEETENGSKIYGNLTSIIFYDTETGKVIYSCIYNIDFSYTVNIKNPYEQLKESKQLDYVCKMRQFGGNSLLSHFLFAILSRFSNNILNIFVNFVKLDQNVLQPNYKCVIIQAV